MSRLGHSEADSGINTAARWCMRGEEMHTLAEEAHGPGVRAMMLRIVADYERLAKRTEEQGKLKKEGRT